MRLILFLLIFCFTATNALGSSPSEWHKDDWVKFIDSSIGITMGEVQGGAAAAVAGRAVQTVPLADVYAALSAIGGATKEGLTLWLNTKANNAVIEGDWERAWRYRAFFNCLVHNSCEDLRHIEAEHKNIKDISTGEPTGTLVDSLTIPNDRPEKVESTIVLEVGRSYTIRASGVVSDWADHDEGVDAVWCYADWRCGQAGLAWNQLRIDGQGMMDLAGTTIPYNPAHEYEVTYEGKGKRLTFWMWDAMSSSADNSGAIYVDIYR